MSNYKLKFTLKQHTPIIHFQHDQHGATLRASELKPKLDKFLIEKFGGEQQLRNEHPDWFINKEHPALDYKVKIKSSDINNIVIKNESNYILPNYFANMGSNYVHKALSIANKIEVIFITYNSKIYDEIERRFNEFLFTHNFGTRQSKGFGSFTLSNYQLTDNLFDVYFNANNSDCNEHTLRHNNNLYTGIWRDYLKLFWQIEIFYKNIRSGINRKGPGGITRFYIKPVIFYYTMNRLNKQWDKKSIKEYYAIGELGRQRIQYGNPDILTYSDSDNPHILIKDILGLSSDENWRSYRNNVTKNHTEIDRFKSPMFFKPFLNNNRFVVAIKCFDINPNFLGQTFDINFGNRSGLQLKTPVTFDWNDFWDYYLNSLPSLDDRVYSDNEVTEQFEYCILDNIKIKQFEI